MGKKSKTLKIQASLPTVSIVTINQIKRQETIKITAELIKNQTYKNIVEWVIVEGSKTLEDCLANELFIKTLISSVPIVYVPGYHTNSEGIAVYNGTHLGELRNISNRTATGDIIVVMDDDDIYFNTRVEHCVTMLTGSKCEIAGCSGKYLYDYCLERLVLFKPYGPYHSTNDCFAYKRSYLANNSYDPMADHAEEALFTKKFTNPMVQLDAKHTIVGSSHSNNTFNKKEICIQGCLFRNPEKPEEGYMYPQITHPTETIVDIVGQELFDRYQSIFNKNEISNYDIIYFCGGTSIDWDPTSQSLGGSEQAIVHICAEWVKMGKKVAVYAKLKEQSSQANGLKEQSSQANGVQISEVEYRGVNYIDWKKFPFHQSHQIVILWRMSGINCGLLFPIKAKKLFVDYHDNNFTFRHAYLPYIDKIDRIFFKSDFHLEYYQQFLKLKCDPERYAIVPNGIRVSDFNNSPQVQREPFRFCYCSCYTRGLSDILQFIWPVIFHHFPQAELHCYYGMDAVDPQSKQRLTTLMGQPGVMDHGRRPMKDIILEKWKSTFQLYITDFTGEIDCISIREALVTGCIPLISNSNLFKNRDGLHFDLEKTPQGYQKIAQGICNLLQKPDFIGMARDKFKQSPSIMDWKTVASKWVQFM